MIQNLLQKYNVPVPRYTSYPPANYFTDTFTNTDYEAAIEASNTASPGHISFSMYIFLFAVIFAIIADVIRLQ